MKCCTEHQSFQAHVICNWPLVPSHPPACAGPELFSVTPPPSIFDSLDLSTALLQVSQQAAALAADAAAGVGGRLMAIKFLEELVLVCNPDSWPSQMLVSPAQVPCTAHDSSSD